MYKCTSITKLETIADTDVLKVSLSNPENVLDAKDAIWFYDYTEALAFLDHDVLVNFRKEMYNGNIVDVVNTFTVPTQINTLDKATGIKLYSEAEDNFATCSFHDIAVNEELPNAVLYCISQRVRSSQKATWLELTVRDKLFHVATLRIFAYSNQNDYTGHYVYVTPLVRSEYGLQTEELKAVDGEVPENPEISIAEEYVTNFFAHNIPVLQNMSNAHLLESLATQVDLELGYRLVRLATELALTESFQNVTNTLDITSIQEALVADAIAYTKPESILSHTVVACMLASKMSWTNKKKVVRILDISEEPPVERIVFQQVKEMANTILENKKGMIE